MSSGSLFYSLFTSFHLFDDYLPILHYRLDVEFIVLILSAVAFVGYFLAFGQRGRLLYFAAALGVFLLALISPFSALANGYLFSAHMVQHICSCSSFPRFCC
jgi:Cytochrome c oxidase caa3 assembly factor (Caa3_CtaG).